MKEIKFTTKYEEPLFFSDEHFKEKYEERVGNNDSYTQIVSGEVKHLAVCPRCNNPVVILGVYKKIDVSPHARHVRNIDIPHVTSYNEYKYLNCPYYRKNANYIREYVPETEEPQRKELYRITKENFDKAIYLIQKELGLYISRDMAMSIAENYVEERAYNYIDATNYNIPWYLIYCYPGFDLYHKLIRSGSTLYRHLKKTGVRLNTSRKEGYVYVADSYELVLRVVNYRYHVDSDYNLNEWLDCSLLMPDSDSEDVLLYKAVDRFSIKVDSYHFGHLINYKDWDPINPLLEIAESVMKV